MTNQPAVTTTINRRSESRIESEQASHPRSEPNPSMSYTCTNCKSTVEFTDYDRRAGVRCPYCGHRVWIKDRGRDTKPVHVT